MPDFGSDTANVPTTKKSVPRPSEYTNSASAPKPTLRVVATHASSTVSTGPVHGAAMRPLTKPTPNEPFGPAPPTCASLFWSAGGSVISNAPNMLAAIATNSSASAPATHGLELTAPKP